MSDELRVRTQSSELGTQGPEIKNYNKNKWHVQLKKVLM